MAACRQHGITTQPIPQQVALARYVMTTVKTVRDDPFLSDHLASHSVWSLWPLIFSDAVAVHLPCFAPTGQSIAET